MLKGNRNIFWNVFWLIFWHQVLGHLYTFVFKTNFMLCFIFLDMLLLHLKGDRSFQWSVFNLNPESFKCKSSWLKTLISLLPWYTKQRGYIVCIPITNYDRGFTQKRAGLLGPKQAERSFFYQVTIECGAILPACSCLRLCSPLCLVTFTQCHV